MNRHVFVALAVVLGVAVEGLPQHRFQPYQFAFTAGKHASASTGIVRGVDAPADSVIPIEEPAFSAPLSEEPAHIQESTLTLVDETPAVETPVNEASENAVVQQFWKKAAVNLVNIPHLLRWVSSLNPETLMTTLREQQESVVPAPHIIPAEASKAVMPQEDSNVENIEARASLYETEYTTEEPQVIQEEVLVSQAQGTQEEIVAPVQAETELQQYEPLQETKLMGESTIGQPAAQVEQEVTYTEPEAVEAVVSAEPEPAVEITSIQMGNAAKAQPQPTEEVAYAQPEPVEEIQQYVQPQEVYKERVWQQEQHYERPTASIFEKPTFTENKKSFFKFKSNKYDSRKQQSLKRGKTLFNFAPAEPRENTQSFSSFTFPAYSYSFSHTPRSYYGRR